MKPRLWFTFFTILWSPYIFHVSKDGFIFFHSQRVFIPLCIYGNQFTPSIYCPRGPTAKPFCSGREPVAFKQNETYSACDWDGDEDSVVNFVFCRLWYIFISGKH